MTRGPLQPELFEPNEERRAQLISRANVLRARSVQFLRSEPALTGEAERGDVVAVATWPATLGVAATEQIALGIRFYRTIGLLWPNEDDPRELEAVTSELPLEAAAYYAGDAHEAPVERDLWRRYFSVRAAGWYLDEPDLARRCGYLVVDHGVHLRPSEIDWYQEKGTPGGPLDRYKEELKSLLHKCRESNVLLVGFQAHYRDQDLLKYLDRELAPEEPGPTPGDIFWNDHVFLNGVDPDEQLYLTGPLYKNFQVMKSVQELPDVVVRKDESLLETGDIVGQRVAAAYVGYDRAGYIRYEFADPTADRPLGLPDVAGFVREHVGPGAVPLAAASAVDALYHSEFEK